MTVEELIAKLQTFPKDLPVRYWYYDERLEEGSYEDISASENSIYIAADKDGTGEKFLCLL